jgi:hypothetical protein
MEAMYLVVGFIVSLIVIKAQLKKTGAGKCKMCRTCDFKLDFEKREKEAESA